MLNILLVGLGGATGAIARHVVSGQALRVLGRGWPYGTFVVNVAGGLLMGLLVGVLAHRAAGDERMRLLFGVGALGGFTTFSAFSLELVLMIERREYLQAFGYAGASVVAAVGAVFAGLWMVRRLVA